MNFADLIASGASTGECRSEMLATLLAVCSAAAAADDERDGGGSSGWGLLVAKLVEADVQRRCLGLERRAWEVALAPLLEPPGPVAAEEEWALVAEHSAVPDVIATAPRSARMGRAVLRCTAVLRETPVAYLPVRSTAAVDRLPAGTLCRREPLPADDLRIGATTLTEDRETDVVEVA
jgi:hypothetical protein